MLLRASLLRRRTTRTASERRSAGERIADHGRVAADKARAVAAYAAVGDEPPTRPLVEALIRAGTRVVVPAVDGEGLRWGEVNDWAELVPSSLGLLEPGALSADAGFLAAGADLILLPALAVDRRGYRLGRGGGFYDRWLPRSPRGRLVAVVYDDEVVDEVPHEPHDRRVHAALTPGGFVELGQ